MFPYLRPMDRFLDDCNGSETCDDWNCLNCDNKTRLTDWLTERVGKANWGAEVESREIRSWCQSVCFYMKEVLSGLDNNKLRLIILRLAWNTILRWKKAVVLT